MKIEIDGLPVIFPYGYIYPEKYAYLGNEQFLALGPTARRNLCVNQIVSLQKNGSVVDSMCNVPEFNRAVC